MQSEKLSTKSLSALIDKIIIYVILCHINEIPLFNKNSSEQKSVFILRKEFLNEGRSCSLRTKYKWILWNTSEIFFFLNRKKEEAGFARKNKIKEKTKYE